MENIYTEKFTSINMTSIKGDMESIWSGSASSTLCTSLDEAIAAVNDVKSSLENFDNALVLLEKYKDNESKIINYNNAIEQEQTYPTLRSSERYIEDGVEKFNIVYKVNQSLIDSCLTSINTLESENLELKTEIESILATILPVNLQPKNNHDIAHRGSKFDGERNNYQILDNSLDAFINAGENGFWGAEADVIQDSNGNLVCSHNAVKDGENPISFEQYLNVCREYGMTAIIDMKYSNGWSTAGEDEYVNQILDTIEEMGMMDSCVIQTNNHHDITNIRNNSEDARIWYLTDNVSNDNIQFILDNNVECVNTQNTDGVTSRVAKLSQNGIDSCVWAVFSQETKDNLINRGATYIMSDNVLGITPYQEGDEDYNDIVN